MKTFIITDENSPLGSRIYNFLVRNNSYLRQLYNFIANEIVSKAPKGKMLDVGTGPGFLPIDVARLHGFRSVVGLDISPTMVRLGRRNAKRLCPPGCVSFVVGDAAELPFQDGSFDFVTSLLSMHHWDRCQEALREISRVLRKGGEAWIYDVLRDPSAESLDEFVERKGRLLRFLFRILTKVHPFPSHQEIKAVLDSSGLPFTAMIMEEQQIFFRLRLVK